ncbi:MAG: diguanylate cyclase [Chloroflexi bacterium]|nr:diguanylate cyclase [Chloroflexota bacterium]
MSRLRAVAPLLPAAVLAILALAVAVAGSAPGAAAVLAFATVGSLVGTAATAVSARADAVALRRRLAALADGSATPELASPWYGPLAPVARGLVDAAAAFHAAQEAATVDRLTHVLNRPAMIERLFEEVDRATRYGRPLSLAFVDLDHFKTVNDTHGHAVGDVVLRGVAAVFLENLRDIDVVGRYGGEEFVIVLPETPIGEAMAVVEKLRLLMLKQRFRAGDGTELTVSISIGLAGGHGTRLRAEDLIRDADAAMYSAKALGRNQVYVFSEPDDDARIPRAPISPAGRAKAAEVGITARQAAEAALSAAVSPLPHYRGKPSSLIAAIAVRLARELGLPEQEVERVRVASLLHDIGKVAVPEQILEKPGPLTTDEWQSVVQHPRIGQAIIDQVGAVRDAGAIILHHHERFSGHGYPYGLRGSDIPLGARIVAIADAYDAMINDRPYRRGVGHESAVAELRRHAEIQFDPKLVDLFCDIYGREAPVPDPSLLIAPSPQGRGAAQISRASRRAASA